MSQLITQYTNAQVKEAIMSGKVPACEAKVNGSRCTGILKPDIVMFGEPLPRVYCLHI